MFMLLLLTWNQYRVWKLFAVELYHCSLIVLKQQLANTREIRIVSLNVVMMKI